MIAETLVNEVVDWWLFVAVFLFVPLALWAKGYDVIQRFRRRARSTADEEAALIRDTKDEAANKSAYSQTRRSEIRFHG